MIRALAWLLLGGAAFVAAGAAQSAADAENPAMAAARVHLLDHLHRLRPDIERFELTPIGHLPAVIPVGAPIEATHGRVLESRTCVWIKVGRAGSPAGSVPVWFSVKAYRPVLVSQRNRSARDSVNAGDFTVEERDVARLSGIPLALDVDVTRMRARHTLASGRIVMKEDLEEMPQILRGQEVTVEVRHGSVAIETSAVAVREARLGEPVTLQNPSSHRNYAARVIGQAHAVVIE